MFLIEIYLILCKTKNWILYKNWFPFFSILQKSHFNFDNINTELNILIWVSTTSCSTTSNATGNFLQFIFLDLYNFSYILNAKSASNQNSWSMEVIKQNLLWNNRKNCFFHAIYSHCLDEASLFSLQERNENDDRKMTQTLSNVLE